MSVARYTSAFGEHSRSSIRQFSYRSLTPGPPPFTNGSQSRIMAQAVRLVPKKGTRKGTFRVPTAWGAHAYNVTYRPYHYLSQQNILYGFEAKGDGGDSSHGTPNTAYKTSKSSLAVVVSLDSNTLNRARTEALGKLPEGDFNLGVALAESKQTLTWLAKATVRAVWFIHHARHGRWKKAGKVLGFKNWSDSKGSADGWLEYQYAVIPFLADIYGAQELLKTGFKEKDQVFKVSRQVTNEEGVGHLVTNCPPDRIEGYCREICRVVYYQKVTNATLHGLNSLGLTNPALIAWELVPFSFVIDWLLPIGNFLGALTATQGLTFIAGFEDRIVEYKIDWRTWRYDFLSGVKHWGSAEMYSFQRVVKSNWDLPVPYWKNPFSSTHVVTALALLRSIRK